MAITHDTLSRSGPISRAPGQVPGDCVTTFHDLARYSASKPRSGKGTRWSSGTVTCFATLHPNGAQAHSATTAQQLADCRQGLCLLPRLPSWSTLTSLASACCHDPQDSGKTPLMWAAASGYVDVVKIMLSDMGADVHVANQVCSLPVFNMAHCLCACQVAAGLVACVTDQLCCCPHCMCHQPGVRFT